MAVALIGVGTLQELKLDIQLRPYLNSPLYTPNLHRIQFWEMMASVEAEGGSRDARRREGPMPLAEMGGPAVEGRDVNIGGNVELGAVIGLAAVAAAAAAVVEVVEVVEGLGLADFFPTGAFAYTYLDSNPFLPPLF